LGNKKNVVSGNGICLQIMVDFIKPQMVKLGNEKSTFPLVHLRYLQQVSSY